MQGPELNIGFVVNGVPLASGGRLLPKRGLATGDQLLLAKPLGTGTLFAAHMQHAADGRHISSALDSMLLSNGPAAELAIAHGASACTDITGFGLLGHLLEMLEAGQGARLGLAQLPLLPGALQQLAAGTVSSNHAVNATARVLLEGEAVIDEPRLEMLFDPQTSGGLLIGIAPERAANLGDALRRSGYSQAAVIGEVVARTADTAAVTFY
jgi:selenide,water dikinase